MKKSLKLSALATSMLLSVTGCNSETDNVTYTPVTINIAHINDHHSHLEADPSQTFNFNGESYQAELGGFSRVAQVFADLAQQYVNQNFLKLHAGDALTGTSYYSFYQGAADADAMNSICFDAFELGNHEFDDGDATLKGFIDRLHTGSCQTPVLAANVVAKVGTPLAPKTSTDYLKPYTIKQTKEGVKIGIIGVNNKGKTQNSSRPLSTTQILEEQATAQKYIDELKNQGIEHIVLLTHLGYDNDIKIAKNLTGVDVIIGGDSHTLLGSYNSYATNNFGSQGKYPTITTNKNGETVCIGQAWEYSKAVGLMNISFNDKGSVASCTGSTILPISNTLQKLNTATGKYEAMAEATNQSVVAQLANNKAYLLKQDVLLPVTPNPTTQNIINGYKTQLSTKLAEKIGVANDTFCLVRVPGTSNSATKVGCEYSAKYAKGSDAAQLVAKAFLNASLRADFSLQNAGGVREALMKGDVTNQTAYTILPFSNTLVNLNITGREVVAALEDAVKNASFGIDGQAPSTGAHPYADGLRWDLRLNQDYGQRVVNVEVRDRNTGVWSPIDPTKTYVMVTNDYIASGKDGYLTLAPIFADANRVEDTKLLYTQSLVDYIKKTGTLTLPNRADYSHKSVVTKAGVTLLP